MLKKLFAAIVAATMVLGLASFATAATPSFPDTVGIPEETQIATLKALGIVTGDEQGRFNPNGTFTRAQMAVIAVKLMGQGGTAELMSQPTVFPDVQARHQWAWGYINVAVGQGIITGRPDGTFGPDDPATYVDVLVLLLRILNYEPILTGTWPTKYLVKANEIGLTKGVSFRADNPATRRHVAVLAHNALTVPKVVQTAYGAEPKYVVSGTENTELKTLLDNLGTAPVEGWLVSSPEIFGAAKDEIVVWVDSEEGTKGEIDPGEEVTIPLSEGTDVTGLLGHQVKVWKNTEGQAFLVQDKTPASAIKAAYRGTDGKFYLVANNKEVDTANVYWFQDYKPYVVGTFTPQSNAVYEHTIIYDGVTPKFAVSLGYLTGVVDSVSTIYQRITFQDMAGTLQLKDWNVRFVGAAEELADLQKNDVVQYIADGTNKEAVLIVTRNAPTGTFTRMDGTTITVGGVQYKLASGATAASESLIGCDVKVLLNKSGRYVKLIALTAPAAPSTIAVVLDRIANVPTVNGLTDFWKLLLADGTKTTLPIDSALYNAAAEYDIVEYKVTDGVISEVAPVLKSAAPMELIPAYKLVDGKLVTDTTAIFEIRDTDNDGDYDICRAITWDALKDMDDLVGWVEPDPNNISKAKIVRITSAAAAVTEDKLYGVVVGTYKQWNPDKEQVEDLVSVLIDGTVVDYVYGSSTVALESGTVVGFQLSAGKAIFASVPEDQPAGTGYEWRVESIDGNLVTLRKYEADGDKTNTTTSYLIVTQTSELVKAKTQFVDLTGDEPEPLSGLSVGLKVQVYSDEAISRTPVAKVITVVE